MSNVLLEIKNKEKLCCFHLSHSTTTLGYSKPPPLPTYDTVRVLTVIISAITRNASLNARTVYAFLAVDVMVAAQITSQV